MLAGARAKELTRTKDWLSVERSDGSFVAIEGDRILVAVGRKPATEGWDLEAIDLDMVGLFIDDDDRCPTSMRGVYAIGDCPANRRWPTGATIALLLGIQGVARGVLDCRRRSALPSRRARLEGVAGTIFAHPTPSEGMLEAALKTLGEPIHV